MEIQKVMAEGEAGLAKAFSDGSIHGKTTVPTSIPKMVSIICMACRTGLLGSHHPRGRKRCKSSG